MWLPYFCFVVPYLLMSGLFYYLDNYSTYALLFRHHKTPHIDKIYSMVTSTVLFNLLLVHPIITYLTSHFVKITYDNFSWKYNMECLAFFSVIFEVSFYCVHRLFHTEFFYKYVHYWHHKQVITVALGAVYCHPIEHILANYIPAALGFVLLEEVHICVVCLWSIIAAVKVTLDHSGYWGNHLKHHKYFNCYFGALEIMDFFFKTELYPNERPFLEKQL